MMCGRLVTAIVLYMQLTGVWTFGNDNCAVHAVDWCVDVWKRLLCCSAVDWRVDVW